MQGEERPLLAVHVAAKEEMTRRNPITTCCRNEKKARRRLSQQFQDMKMQPSPECALGHEQMLKAWALVSS